MTDNKLKVRWSTLVEKVIKTDESELTAQELIIKNTLNTLENTLREADKRALENKLNREFEEKNGEYFL
jgi:hypothetical protein